MLVNVLVIVSDLIKSESKLVPASKIILGGFSQGAAMSMFAGLQYPERLAGVIALSGYLPFYDRFEDVSMNLNFLTESNRNMIIVYFGCRWLVMQIRILLF